MKKMNMLMIMLLLLVSMVSADNYVSVELTTDNDMYVKEEFNAKGNIYYSNNINSGNNSEVWIDGLNYDDELNRIWSNEADWRSGLSYMSVAKIIKYSSAIVQFGNVRKDLHHSPSDEELMIAESLDNAFISHQEGEYLLELINQLNMRIEALENTLTELNAEVTCNHKIDVSNKYGLKSVDCEDITFYNTNIKGFEAIGIKEVYVPQTENNESNEIKCEPGKSLCDDNICRYVCIKPLPAPSLEYVCEETECVNGEKVRTCKPKGYSSGVIKNNVSCEIN